MHTRAMTPEDYRKYQRRRTQDDYVLTFTSSDPESISVDENGQIEALKAIAGYTTATLEYMNKTYTDICLVCQF